MLCLKWITTVPDQLRPNLSVRYVYAMLLLGPLPDHLRPIVQRLIVEARAKHSGADDEFLGYLLCGGPGGSNYLDEAGEVWTWTCGADGLDENVERIPDGPRKIGSIAIAALRVRELVEWLPRRPSTATDCGVCKSTGWLQPPLPLLLCSECFGLGWLVPNGAR